MSRTITITLIVILTTSSNIMFESASAATVLQPSVPEFTLQYIDRSYEKPPTYEVDPLTGQSIIKESGYHVANRNVDVTIKNLPFTPSIDSSGNWTRMYYGVQFKGHYEDQWKNIQDPKYYGYYNVSQTDQTVITINLEYFYANSLNAAQRNETENSIQLDVQVETLIGIDYRIPTMTPWGPSCYYEFNGKSSGFSDIQTLDLATNIATTIPNTSTAPLDIQQFNPSPSPNVPPTPSVPEFPVLTVLSLLVVIPLLLTFILRKKPPKSSIK